MRVVHVVTRSHRRGAEVVALELADALDALGHENELHAIALASDGQSVSGLPALVPSRRLGARTFLQSSLRLRRLLSRRPADIVLAHGGSAALVVAFSVPTSTAARVWQRILGLPLERWGPLRRRGWKAIAQRFDGVVALTAELESEVRQIGYDGPVWVIPNARDPARFAAVDRDVASVALRSQIGLGPDVPLLAFVGHLVAQKQPELAVDVLAELRRRGQPAHLVVAGDGPRRKVVERRIADHRVAEAVTMLGHRDDPELIFGAADLALITSGSEGIPGVAIEAQMTGCPLVSFPVGAVGDVVEDGVTGAIVARPEASLMAECVAGLLRDPSGLRAMSIAAVARAAAFTTATTASLYAARFAEVLSDGNQRTRAGGSGEAS